MASVPDSEFPSAVRVVMPGSDPFAAIVPEVQPFLFGLEPFPPPKGKFYPLVEFRFLVGVGRVSVSVPLEELDASR